MSDPVDVLVQQALKAHLKTPDLTTPATPIAWPFLPYTPVGGVSYIEVHATMRAPIVHAALDFAGSDVTRGIFQVDAVVPDGAGEAAGSRLAALIAARFVLGTLLVAGAYKLQVIKVPQTATPIKDASWVRYPVSVSYIIVTKE